MTPRATRFPCTQARLHGADSDNGKGNPMATENVKYYIGNIEVRNGEYEYSSTVRFKTKGSPYRHLRKVASTWYGEKGKLQYGKDGAYYFHAGCVCVWEGECQELTREVYDAITLVTEL